MPGESINNTTIWTPQRGMDSGWASGGQTTAFGTNTDAAPTANPWNISDPNNPGGMMQDPNATAAPTRVTPNASGTTGIQNPFGLVWNKSQNAGFVPGQGGPGSWGYQPGPGTPPPPANGTPPPNPNVDAAGNFNPNGIGNGDPTGNLRRQNAALAPPDQRGIQGTLNPETGRTEYNTPTGNFSMDEFGNWFDSNGNSALFNQEAGNQPPQDGAETQPAASLYDPAVDAQYKQLGWTKNAQGIWEPGNSPAATTQAAPTTTTNGGPGTSAPPPQQPPNSPFTPQWNQDVKINDPLGVRTANSKQFATDATAQSLADRFGGKVRADQLQGPGYSYSTPQNQISFKNGQTVNAGLLAETLGRKEYGSGAPGSYGEYLANRDITGNYGPSPWDTKINAPQVAEQHTKDVANQQQEDQGQFLQQLLSSLGGQQQRQQQGSMNNNIFSQLAPILAMLQQLGMGGGQQQYQRPPQRSQQSLFGYPYYSRFA